MSSILQSNDALAVIEKCKLVIFVGQFHILYPGFPSPTVKLELYVPISYIESWFRKFKCRT